MKKAIVVVSFGTSKKSGIIKIREFVENVVKEQFLSYDVELVFTSPRILKKLQDTEFQIDHLKIVLDRLKDEGYKEVILLPTYLLMGIEFNKLKLEVEKYKDSFEVIKTVDPLLNKSKEIAEVCIKMFENYKDMNQVVFIGHGTDHFSDCAYAAMNYYFNDLGINNFHVATIEGYIDIEKIEKHLKKDKEVLLVPFMFVSGEHVKNDVIENKDSIKNFLENRGYKVLYVSKGIMEYENIRKLYTRKIRKKIDG